MPKAPRSPPRCWPPHPDVALVVAEDPRAALARRRGPVVWARSPTMVAVTGTNGKTSVASFARQIWMALGHAAINIGTTGVEGAWEAPLAHTTPDPSPCTACWPRPRRRRHPCRDGGVEPRAGPAAAGRGAADGGGVHQPHQDHLDYHGTTWTPISRPRPGCSPGLLPPDAPAVINLDDPLRAPIWPGLAQAAGSGAGHRGDSDLRILNQRFDRRARGAVFPGGAPSGRLNLVGGFQAANVAGGAGSGDGRRGRGRGCLCRCRS
jgi:UDP-N-acetylmuramoyl-L-alanyl-D-glutamate--2,6-diaminopimelate ligase